VKRKISLLSRQTLPGGATAEQQLTVASPSTLLGVVLVHGMFGLTALMGLGVLTGGVRLLLSGEQPWPLALFICLMGVVFMTIGLGYFYVAYVKAPLWAAREARLKALYPGQPWMLRSDWAARKVTSSALGAMIFMWVWVTGWWGAIAFIGTVNRDKILQAMKTSWGDIAVAAIFVLAGLVGLMFAWQMTRSWWQFGRSTLRIDTLPGYLGDSFRGTVHTHYPGRPAQPMEAEIVCEDVRWITSRDSNGRTSQRAQVTPVWSATQAIAPSRMLAARGLSVPIEVALPGDQPPCDLDAEGNGIQWRLHLRTHTDTTPAFGCSFDVPVYARG
jgi:hypothetical protein